jgi:hypothetical protein
VRTANAQELVDRLKDTGTGRMFADPQIKPFVDRVMGQVSAIYSEQAEGEVGVSWSDLTKLPKGEVAFGIVARPDAMPEFLLLIDQGGEQTSVGALINRALKAAEEQGRELTKETIGGVEVTTVHQHRAIGFFEREGTIVASTDKSLLRHVLYHWDGTKSAGGDSTASGGSGEQAEFIPGPPLEENQKFIAIMSQCRRPSDPPPNLIFYADPIEAVRQFGRAEPGVQIALALLPRLGLDGIQGVGGALTYATGQFDGLTHLHILLNNPRAGILSMLAFDSGDHTPQPFIPYETDTYITAHWNFASFYARLASIVDSFRGEGSFEQMINAQVGPALGIDFKTQIVDNLAGRVTLFTGYEKPVRIQGRHNILAIELVDEAAAQQTLQSIMTRGAERFEQRQFGRAAYYAVKMGRLDEMPEEQRPFHPFVAVFEKHLFVGTSTKLFEQVVAASQGEVPRLADSQDYSRLTATMNETAAGRQPAVLMVQRPELTYRFWYELLGTEAARNFIDEAAAENEIVARFADVLRDGGLPPFEAIKKYAGPAGGILYDTDNGFHGITYALRNE